MPSQRHAVGLGIRDMHQEHPELSALRDVIRNLIRFGLFAVLLCLTSYPAAAQFNSGIRGIVSDPAGAAVEGATATLASLSTGIALHAATDATGTYDFRSLAPGDYRLDIQAPGFSLVSIHSTLLTEQTLNLPVTLTLGGVTQTVNVETEAPLLNTADSRLQTTLPQNQIDSLPVQGRSVIGLTALAPGVTGTGLATTSGIPDNFNVEITNNASANGRGFDGNLYILDGLDITSSVRAGVVNTAPNPDSVQEVALQTNTYSVEYGRAGSIQSAITTKAGSDRLHGSASYYYTSKALWARNEFTPVRGYAPFHYNNFSGTIGGPIFKHRTFFFASTQPLRSISTSSSAITFEAPEFVQWAQANYPASLGTSLLTKYPVTKATITGVSKTAANIFPSTSSNACGTPATHNIPCNLPMIDSGNSSLAPYRNGTQWSVRIDQNFKRDRLYASYYNTTLANVTASPRQGMDYTNSQVSRSGQINETHTFSSWMLNEGAFGGLQIEGITGVTGPFNIPTTTITGQSNAVGVSPAFQDFIQHNYHWRDTFSLVHGRHNIKAGLEGFHGDELTLFGEQHAQPSFVFNNLLNFVQDAPFSESNVYYDPLTGKFAFFNLGVASTTYGLFVQDEWQPRPRLTLTYGIRFDNFGNPHPSKALGSIISNFYLGSGGDLTTQVANGVLKQTPNVFTSSPKAFSPRIGVAWDPTGSGKWAVRGGFGIYHDWLTNGELTVPLRTNLPAYANPTFFSNQGTAPIFALGTSATYPFNYPVPVVAPATPDSHGGVVGQQFSIGGTDPHLREPRIMNYTAGLERALGKHVTLGANYAGSRAVDLPEGDISTITPNNDVNRAAGKLIASGGKLVRPNPSFGTILYTRNGNQSVYNAFIATINGRFGPRDSFQASYTRSRATDYGYQYPDPLAPRSTYRGPSNFNVPQRFSLSESLNLPELKGRSMAVRAAAGGWTISGAVILQSGNPFTVYTTATFSGGGDYNADGYNYDFPNASGYSQATDRRSYLTGVFARSGSAVFSAPAPGTEGNELRNRFSGPGFANTDLSLLKSFSLHEWAHLQVRGDFFNVFNHPNLTNFVSDQSSGSFGRATNAFNARYIQVAARINF